MTAFLIGLVILIGGAAVYGKFCEKVFGPDDRQTPAYTKEDGVDYVPMKGWKYNLPAPSLDPSRASCGVTSHGQPDPVPVRLPGHHRLDV